MTTGEPERLKSRACFFLRNVAPERSTKVDIGSEAAGSPLEPLNMSLSEVFRPITGRNFDSELKKTQKEFDLDLRNASYADVVWDAPEVVTHFGTYMTTGAPVMERPVTKMAPTTMAAPMTMV